jgi:hypothetical protein
MSKVIDEKKKQQIKDFLDDWLRIELPLVFDEMWDSGKNSCGHLGGELYEKFGITYRGVCRNNLWNSVFLKEVEEQLNKWGCN